jgi:hypothetical protein
MLVEKTVILELGESQSSKLLKILLNKTVQIVDGGKSEKMVISKGCVCSRVRERNKLEKPSE